MPRVREEINHPFVLVIAVLLYWTVRQLLSIGYMIQSTGTVSTVPYSDWLPVV